MKRSGINNAIPDQQTPTKRPRPNDVDRSGANGLFTDQQTPPGSPTLNDGDTTDTPTPK